MNNMDKKKSSICIKMNNTSFIASLHSFLNFTKPRYVLETLPNKTQIDLQVDNLLIIKMIRLVLSD